MARPAPSTEDVGLFGPDSIAWRVHSSPYGLVGGVRALLIQALNPLAMAAVAEHSDYREDPWARLIRTTEYIMHTTFGDTETAHAAAARVRAIHKHVRGIDDFTGLPYRADDPELLLWIHAVEVHSFMTGYHHFDTKLTDEEADRYVAEMVTAAELVGLHAEDVPDNLDDLRAYLGSQELVASPAARDALKFILVPPVVWPGGKYPDFPGSRLVLAAPGRVAWAIPSAAAVALLPEKARRAYRLPYLRPALPYLKLSMGAFIRAMRMVAPPPPSMVEAQRRVRTFAA